MEWKLEKDPELRNRQLSTHRQRAVREAWKKESSLVQEGKGTRDWTKEQQKELLTNGKVHGMQGHHMKSVQHYPQQAKNPDNIQFLTHDEHLKGAHRGKYRNVCNGYYDPATGKMEEFKGRELRPVKVRSLSHPLSRQEVEKSVEAGKNHVQKPDTSQKKNYSGKAADRKSRQSLSQRTEQNRSPVKAAEQKHSSPAREKTEIKATVSGSSQGKQSGGHSTSSREKTGIKSSMSGSSHGKQTASGQSQTSHSTHSRSESQNR